MALSDDISRDNLAIVQPMMTYPLAADQVVYQGAIIGIDTADGYAYIGKVSTTLSVVGVAAFACDSTGLADGDLDISVSPGVFGWFTSGGGADTIATDDRTKPCYVSDDDTVNLTNGGATRSRAGLIHDVNSDGYVAVKFEVL